MTTGQLVTSQLVCDVTINRSRTTSATANLGFHSQSSFEPCNLQVMICCWMNDNPKICTCNLQVMICCWMNDNPKICTSDAMNLDLKTTEISKRCVFVLVTWPWRLPEEWPEACSSLTVVGAGTMHGFGTDPIRNPTIWLVESQNQVN